MLVSTRWATAHGPLGLIRVLGQNSLADRVSCAQAHTEIKYGCEEHDPGKNQHYSQERDRPCFFSAYRVVFAHGLFTRLSISTTAPPRRRSPG